MADGFDAPSHVTAGRRLTARELVTIRAALRLWIETEAAAIPDACHVEVGHPGLILTDDEIERLLVALAYADTAIVCAAPAKRDPRRP